MYRNQVLFHFTLREIHSKHLYDWRVLPPHPTPPLGSQTGILTKSTKIVNEDNLMQKLFWSPIQDAVYCAQQSRPGLVVEAYDYASPQHGFRIRLVFTSEEEELTR